MIPKMKSTTFAGLASIIGNKSTAVKIGNNTTAERAVGSIVIRYHGHAIVDLSPMGVILMDAGYQTATTKARLNLFAPAGVSIFQKAHRWFVSTGETTAPWNGAAIFPTA